jgi:hypothetical protein
MSKLGIVTRRALYALLHVVGAYGSMVFSFWLVKQTEIPTIPVVVVMFVSLPISLLGILNLYFGSYEDIPGVTWVILIMMLSAGLMFGIGMLLV